MVELGSEIRSGRQPRRALQIMVMFMTVSCGSEQVRRQISPTPTESARMPATPSHTPGADRSTTFRFRFNQNLSQVAATVCFNGEVPTRLKPPLTESADSLLEARAGKRDIRDGGIIELAGVKTGACVDYRVEVEPNRRAQIGNDDPAFLISPDGWFWEPEPRPLHGTMKVAFDLPKGVEVAVPWDRVNDDAAFPYRPSNSLFASKAEAAFGRFPFREQRRLRSITGSEATQEIALLHEVDAKSQKILVDWVHQAADSVGTLLGGFPRDRSLITLSPQRFSRTFGMSIRGGGSMNMLLVPQSPKASDLASDWTATHEMLHFTLPSMTGGSAWLYEGFVTYLTTLARARSGATTERYGWYELLEGLQRGGGSADAIALEEASRTMRQTHSYWHVYWGGAAIAFLTDVELHKQGKSLDGTIATLVKRNVPRTRNLSVTEVLGLLDECSGTKIPSTVANRHLNQAFPETTNTVQWLGVKLTASGKDAIIDEGAPGSAIRRAIMGRRAKASN